MVEIKISLRQRANNNFLIEGYGTDGNRWGSCKIDLGQDKHDIKEFRKYLDMIEDSIKGEVNVVN